MSVFDAAIRNLAASEAWHVIQFEMRIPGLGRGS